jgi:protein phosphatase
VLAVADGMGGALAGEVASRIAVEALVAVGREIHDAESDELAREIVLGAITRANDEIFESSQTDPERRGMGTTLTAALIRDGRVQFFQVGDSRGFLARHDSLHVMTKDHSLIGQLVADKVITPEDADQLEGGRNIILKALGAEASVKIDWSEATLDEGDLVLLCTDGLHGCVKNEEIGEVVAAAVDPGKLCEDLVHLARDRGGPDNITVVAGAVLEGDADPRTPGLLGRVAGMFRRKE